MLTVIGLALFKGLVWSAVLPPWYGPDEASHYEYVQLLVENRQLPSGPDANAAVDYPREILCSQSNFDLGVYGPFHAEPPFGLPTEPCSAASASDRLASGRLNAAAGYTPAYYASAIPFYLLVWPSNVEVRLDAVRLWSVLLGVAAAAFAYLAARSAFLHKPTLAVAMAVVFTLQPMNSQQTAIVNNDALLIAVAAAFWWRFFHTLRNGLSIRDGFVLGGLIGLAYLAKPQGLFLAGVLPILYFVNRKRLPAGYELSLLARLAGAAAGPIAAAIAVGAVYSRLSGATAGLISTSSGVHGIRQYVAAYTVDHFERPYMVWITSFWGYLGWFQVDLPSLVYVVIALIVGAGVLSAAWVVLKQAEWRSILIPSMLGFLVPAAILQLVEVYAFRSSGDLILQGRSFLMLLIPALVVLIAGWQRLFPFGAGWAPAAAVLAAVTLNLVSLFAMLDGFYG